jgi:hypothetical protein
VADTKNESLFGLIRESNLRPALYPPICRGCQRRVQGRQANWIYVGQTTGRGRMDREHKAHRHAVKHIYFYPLDRDAKQRLCGDLTR